MMPQPDVAIPCTPTPASHWPTTPVPDTKRPCSSIIRPARDLPTTPKPLVMPMTPVSPKNKLDVPVELPSTPTLIGACTVTPITPAFVTPLVVPVEKLSPLIAALHTGAPRRCTQNAVCWVPKALPLWTTIVAEVARLNGGWVIPTRRGSPLAM